MKKELIFYTLLGRYICAYIAITKKKKSPSMTRRTRTEVIIDILNESLNGANKTRIMYRANLNFLRFNYYLTEMLENGLLTKENYGDGRVVYKATKNGKALLETLRKAQQFMPI